MSIARHMLPLLFLLGACSSPLISSIPPDIQTVCDGAIDACERSRNPDTCQAALSCVDAREAAELAITDKAEVEELCSVDRQKCQRYKEDRDKAKGQRWTFLGGGFLGGFLLALLLL